MGSDSSKTIDRKYATTGPMTFTGNVVQKTATLNRSAVKITDFVISANSFRGVMEVLSRKFNISGNLMRFDTRYTTEGAFKDKNMFVLFGGGVAELWPAFQPVDILQPKVQFSVNLARVDAN